MILQRNEADLFFVCTMIEVVARKTHNRSRDVVEKLSDKVLLHQLKVASVNHCLSFEQVCDEWIEDYAIPEGDYDNIVSYGNDIPTETSVGKIYQTIILDNLKSRENVIESIRRVYHSLNDTCDYS